MPSIDTLIRKICDLSSTTSVKIMLRFEFSHEFFCDITLTMFFFIEVVSKLVPKNLGNVGLLD